MNKERTSEPIADASDDVGTLRSLLDHTRVEILHGLAEPHAEDEIGRHS